MASTEMQTFAEDQPLIKSEGQGKAQKPQNHLKKAFLWFAAALIATLLILSCLPSAPQKIAHNSSQKIAIPSFSGPQGTIYETVYYSHYVSRILQSAIEEVPSETAIRSIEALEAWMGDWTESHRATLASADLQTAEGILKIYRAYVSARKSADSATFWPNLLGTFRLRAQDVKDEISADEDADRFSLEGHGKMQKIQELIKKEFIGSSWNPEAHDGILTTFRELISSPDKFVTSAKLDETLVQMGKKIEEQTLSQVSGLPMHVRASLLAATANKAGLAQPETLAHKFLNSFEVLRLALPLQPQDQLFARVVELLAVSWNNYMYLKPKSVDYLLAEVQKQQTTSSEAGDWVELAHQVWGKQ